MNNQLNQIVQAMQVLENKIETINSDSSVDAAQQMVIDLYYKVVQPLVDRVVTLESKVATLESTKNQSSDTKNTGEEATNDGNTTTTSSSKPEQS